MANELVKPHISYFSVAIISGEREDRSVEASNCAHFTGNFSVQIYIFNRARRYCRCWHPSRVFSPPSRSRRSSRSGCAFWQITTASCGSQSASCRPARRAKSELNNFLPFHWLSSYLFSQQYDYREIAEGLTRSVRARNRDLLDRERARLQQQRQHELLRRREAHRDLLALLAVGDWKDMLRDACCIE